MNTERVFNVEGIHCPKCVEKLEKTVGSVNGISGITVSEDLKKVTVNFDAALIDAETIIKEIEAVPEKDFIVKD